MKAIVTRIPLTGRVALVVAGLMVLLGVVASQQVLATLKRVQTERIRELATTHVEALSVALGPPVLRGDVWEVFDTLERAAAASSKGRIMFTAVSDVSGSVLAASDPVRASVGTSIEALTEGAQTLKALNFSGTSPTIRIAAPVTYQGRAVGRIASELNVGDLVNERARISQLLILWNGGVTVAFALIGFFATRGMIAPVALVAERMSASTEALEPIAESDLPPGDGELARLARTFNEMVAAIGEKADVERRLAERERFVSLGRLSSSLAHEVNNPLGGLLNATDTIRTYPDNPDVVRKSAELLERGLKHLRDVARATLEQNRIDRSGQPSSLDDFEDLRLLIGPEIRRRGQRLIWEIMVSTPELALFPSAPIRQVLLNLLLNASAAADKGGTVGLHVLAEANSLCLRVSDSGPGLSPAARRRLLSSGPVPPGGGVGLRLVHDLVGDLGGKIEVRRAFETTMIEIRLLPRRKPMEQVVSDAQC